MLSNIEVQNIIPHRYPFLLVDKVLEVEPGKRAVAVKNVTVNEPFFQGHFPGYPIMPGVLIVEALAQTAGIAAASLEENRGRLGVLTGIDSMKFRKQVVPGDVLKLDAEILMLKMGMAKVKVLATVDGQTAAEGEIKFAMVNTEKQK
ncbi:MAG TPA: 3-hydroxyacyl-ACP dehydratase FabZ [Clostridiales bacterium]|nr:3-hydroxyacyl-ACP dehydratase FabZ [Clostridiales bacterium]